MLSKNQKGLTGSIKSPEPTAVGAVSSVPHCGTVHVASRRWLSCYVRPLMKKILAFIFVGLFAGWVLQASPFVQDGTKIVPPIRHAQIQPGLDDGGTIRATITDADGKTFIIYIDKRVIAGGNKTRGDVYLNAYPSESNSVHVLNQQEFRQKIGDFDKSWTNSF